MADDEKVDALFIILEADTDHSHSYSAEELSTFYKRRERYLMGEGKNFSVEEAFDQIRKSK